MDIVVVGAGSLGSFYGSLLARNGHNVTFFARGRTLEVLQNQALRIESKLVDDFTIQVCATNDVTAIQPPDLVFLAVKTYDLDSAARAIAPIVGPETSILAVQNGVDHPQIICQYVERSRIVPGVVYVSATVEHPGHIRQIGGPGWVMIGELDGGPNARTLAIKKVFDGTGIDCTVHENIETVIWQKFMVICAMSGVTALTRLTLQQIFDDEETTGLYLAVMTEVASVATAHGISISAEQAGEMCQTVMNTRPLPERGSMAYDLLTGRRLELSSLNGAAVRLGQEKHVLTPMNWCITASLGPFENGTPHSAA
ncbi:2-dehydropantoate 2-reductase [soil metagenome]